MLQIEVLIIKLGAVNRFSSSAVACCKVTTLNHKLFNDTVEGRALVRELLSSLAYAFLASAKRAEILGGFRYNCEGSA